MLQDHGVAVVPDRVKNMFFVITFSPQQDLSTTNLFLAWRWRRRRNSLMAHLARRNRRGCHARHGRNSLTGLHSILSATTSCATLLETYDSKTEKLGLQSTATTVCV
jgi:hypothetical protein